MRVRPTQKKRLPPVLDKVLSKKLYSGRAVWGRCYQDTGLIVVDPRLRPLEYLDTLIHELLHREFCFLREESVNEVASIIAKEIWEKGYRRHVK